MVIAWIAHRDRIDRLIVIAQIADGDRLDRHRDQPTQIAASADLGLGIP